jgi:uncharacterized damage-inducible protein DinB
MKNVFQLLAEYNIQTDQDMIQIIDQLYPAKINQDVGAYYNSILGILNHMVLSIIYWVRRFAKYYPEIEPLLDDIPETPTASTADIVWSTMDDLKPIIAGLDQQIKRLVNELTEERYSDEIKYTSSKGGEGTMIAWKVLLHLFNHQTHNRGQIAIILDQFGIKNDYSSILWRGL